MKHQLRSAVCTEGRRMAGARALWVANGMKREQIWQADYCHCELVYAIRTGAYPPTRGWTDCEGRD